jgi:hypothetical protein
MSRLKTLGFWPLLGLIVTADIVITLLFTLIVPGLSLREWGDTLCGSALILAIGSAVPVFLDAGRGFGLSGKMGGTKAEQFEALNRERSLREKGMKFTFVLALATFLIGLLSVIVSVV